MEVKPLITPQELAIALQQKSLIVIDTRDSKEYSVSHIPSSVNIREIFTYLANSKPEGLASLQSQFAELLGIAGISGTEQLVIYEDAMNKGYGQSCRGYFLLKYLGCPKVSVLDGGYQAWLNATFPTTAEIPTPEKKSFSMNIDASIMVTTEQMLQALDNPAIVKLDVRDYNEWIGISSSPYGVDYLISRNSQQLTDSGFGYSTSEGNYSNPYFADFLPTPGYLEVFSKPPLIPGAENFGPEDSELPISFSATIITVPEHTSIFSLLALSTFGAGCVLKRKYS